MATNDSTFVFCDTEFTSFEGARLLSVGLVTHDGLECYAELAPTKANLKGASTFVLDTVVPQFELVPGAQCASLVEMAARVANWLDAIPGPLGMCFDFEGDRHLLVQLLSLAPANMRERLAPRLSWLLVDVDALGDVSDAAAEAVFRDCALRGLAEHHALADALALRARVLAHSADDEPA